MAVVVAIDNDFGAATESAVGAFQAARGLAATGRVDEATFAALTAPMRAAAETFRTIEGNTNDDGVREGYEVCARTRNYKKRDFVALER
jgi:peptidoglycan hydrolase-like protein with peptidoglycan-binding domain